MIYDELWKQLCSRYDRGEAQAIVRLVLESRFGLSLTDIICGGVERLSTDEMAQLEDIMVRLNAGEPVQYVLGEAEFGGRIFKVAPGVLIPRPETEDLCDWVASNAKGARDILDIGTGSGCIAISLALDNACPQITAWDISDDALRISRTNADSLGAAVRFVKQDALRPPKDESRWDIIVSNPPYICERERAAMEAHVLDHEPATALFVPDDDPLLFYRAIAEYASAALRPGGSLFFETNTQYAEATADMLCQMGFDDVETRADRFGKPRFVKGSIKRG